MARADANINREALGYICSQVGVTVTFFPRGKGQRVVGYFKYRLSDNQSGYPN